VDDRRTHGQVAERSVGQKKKKKKGGMLVLDALKWHLTNKVETVTSSK
jgi:hypothetical protein